MSQAAKYVDVETEEKLVWKDSPVMTAPDRRRDWPAVGGGRRVLVFAADVASEQRPSTMVR